MVRSAADTGTGKTPQWFGAWKEIPVVTEVRLRSRTVHGYRRAFRMAGKGPAILLIHGIGDSSSTWSGVIPALAQRYRVIAPDLLGHGASDKPRADYSV